MEIGITLRNMGPAAEPAILARCARAADESSLDSVWVMDHVAIPPDDAEGSGGLYLDFINECFSREVMEANGQPFLFRPRPPRPPIYIGGKAPHALTRAVKYGDGWFPIAEVLSQLREGVKTYRELASRAGRDEPEVVTFGQVPLEDSATALDTLAAYREAGVTHFIHGLRYDQPGPFIDAVSALEGLLAT